jgi:hypothetical protein
MEGRNDDRKKYRGRYGGVKKYGVEETEWKTERNRRTELKEGEEKTRREGKNKRKPVEKGGNLGQKMEE